MCEQSCCKEFITLSISWHIQEPAELLTKVGEWLETNRPDLAQAYFYAATLVNPTYDLAWYRLGDLCLRIGQYEQAVDAFRHAVELAPDHHPTWYKLSLALAQMGDIQGALEASLRVLQMAPLHSGAWLQRLRLLAKLGRWEEVYQLCQEVPKSLQSSKEVHQLCCQARQKAL